MTRLRIPRTRERTRPTADTAAGTPRRAVSRPPEQIRWSRIAAVQRRIAGGFYDRVEVQRAVVKALIDQLDRS